MSNTPYIIEGCKSPTGVVHPRLNILDLQKVPKQWTLFIRALNNIMRPDYKFEGSDAVNWEQMAVMSSPQTQAPIRIAGKGIVITKELHEDVLFPTWHRVVMLLVEQAVWKEAKAIARDTFSMSTVIRDQWKQAAETLRFPYWDWTVPVVPGSEYLPALFKAENVNIVDTNGRAYSTKNPLHSYRFGPVHNTFTDHDDTHSYLKSWDRTYRWPTEVRTNPTEQYQSLNNSFMSGGPGPEQHNVDWLRDKIAHLFTFSPNLDPKLSGNVWDCFSNASVLQKGQVANQTVDPYSFMRTSIEESHDSVHLDIGGNGHMGNNDVAAFDPIFWLHHCNVDRIYAFWEYAYPSYWVGNGWYDPVAKVAKEFVSSDGTYLDGKDSVINQASNLTPFRKSSTTYWTSNDTRGLQPGQGTPKYYTYPPIEYGSTKVQVDKPFDSTKQLEYLSALQKHWGLVLDVPLTRNELPVLDTPIFQRPVPGSIGCPPGYQSVGKFKIFIVVVTVSEHAYEGSFHVELCPRDVPNVVINRVSFLRRRAIDRCDACVGRQAAHSLVRATMILDSSDICSLIRGAGLNRADAGDDAVIQLLKTSFNARVVTPGGGLLAESQYGATRAPGAKLLDAGIPNMAFHSACVAHPVGNPSGEIQFYDWINHTTIPGGDCQWVDKR